MLNKNVTLFSRPIDYNCSQYSLLVISAFSLLKNNVLHDFVWYDYKMTK